MKKLVLGLAAWALAACALAGPNSIVITQRNSLDTGNVQRILDNPPTDGLLIWNKATALPSYYTLGNGLVTTNGVLSAAPTTQVNADWNATSGAAQILNRPALSTVAITGQAVDLMGLSLVALSGSYADLANKPTLFSGSWADLSGKPAFAPVSFSGSYNDLTNKPSIPAPAVFDFSAPTVRTLALSTAYQAATLTKPAIVTISPSCVNATTLLASSACALQVRQSTTSGLNCTNGTLAMTWTSTVQLGLVFTQTSGSPFDVKVPAGSYFILCPTSGTFTIAAVEQTAG